MLLYKLDDLTRTVMQPVIQNLLICNPSNRFSLERIHDYLMDHFQIDLNQTTSRQRSNFSERMRRTLNQLTAIGLAAKHKEVVALFAGHRIKYSYNKKTI
jgi:hypothetical protein